MNTKLQTLVNDNEAVVDRSFDRILSDKEYEVVAALHGENALEAVNDAEMQASPARSSMAKTIMMFIAAPFIALTYIVALPFIGFYQFAKLAFEAYSKKHPATAGKIAKAMLFAKNVALFLVSPFIALAYVFALPFVGFYMFAKLMLEVQQKRQLNT